MKAKGYSTIAGLEKATPEEIKQRNVEHYGSKIKTFRNRAGLSAEQLADALQISKSSIRNWECGLTRPDPEFLYRMFSILDVEPNEFFGLKGVGTLLTTSERALIDNYRMLDRSGKEAVETFAQAMTEKMHIRQLRRAYQRLNSVSDKERRFAAGDHSTEWADYPDIAEVYLYDNPLVRNADEVVTVSGASMEPQFLDGDQVLIEYCSDIRNGDIGCFYVPGIGGVIKQKLYDRLHSLNPQFDDIIVSEEGARIVGRVLAVIDEDMRPKQSEIDLFLEALEEKERHPEWFD